jgi:hypothetical protein
MRRTLAMALGFGLVAAHTTAHAWFFFFVPGEVTSAIADKLTGSEGEHCIGTANAVGDRISVGGAVFIVKSTSGTSSRCTNTAHPIRARLEPAPPQVVTIPPPAPAPALAANATCVALGVSQGDRVPIAGRDVEVVRIIRNGPPCDYPSPMIAEYREALALPTQPETTVAVEPAPGFFPRIVSLPAAPVGRTVQERLRELKLLRDENLITQENYEAKQREILSSQ